MRTDRKAKPAIAFENTQRRENQMSILPKLFSAFKSAGHTPLTGYNPCHFANWRDAPFTQFVFNGGLVGVAGLALQEVMFLEGLSGLIDPRSILVIGNAHGWSTIALALIFPRARVVAIDPGEKGNALTNQIAKSHGLNAVAATGRSPEDVPRLFGDGFGPELDFCLIDAMHDDEHLKADFSAIYPFLAKGGVVAMHDVINWNMIAGYRSIIEQPGISGALLTRTPSGMGLAWRDRIPETLSEYIGVFTEPAELYRSYRAVTCLNMAEAAIAAY